MPRRSWLLFAAMCVIWGVPYLLIRVAVRDLTPAALVFARTAIGGLVLLPFALRVGGFGLVLRRWRPLLAFTVIELAIPWLLLSDAETRISSSLSGLLVAAVPLVGVVAATVTGSQDRVDSTRLAGLLVGVVGVVGLVGLDLGELRPGPLLELGVVVTGYAVAPMIMARHLADLPRVPVVAASLLLTAAAYLPVAVIQRPARLDPSVLASVLVLGVVCTALAFVLFFALITDIGPGRAVVITYVNPAVAVLLGVVFLHEPFTDGMAVGFPLILFGSVLAARRRAVPPAAGASSVEAAAGSDPDQSTRTAPPTVSNTTASKPESSSSGRLQSTATPSSGCVADTPR
jgi:drug/metabolite transporter (DMT)-like permease